MDLVEAATKGELTLILALTVGIVALAGVVVYLFRMVVKVYEARVARAESLTDKANENNDRLARLFQGALDELRRR